MPFNINPIPSPVGLLSQSVNNMLGSYGEGYAKMAPQLMQARPSGAAAGATMMAPLQDLSKSFQDAYHQSYGSLSNMALQKQSQDFHLEEQRRGQQNAMEQIGARNFYDANELYMRQTGVPYADIPGPDGQVIPGVTGSMYDQAVSAGQINPTQVTRPQYGVQFAQNAEQSRFQKSMEQKGMVYDFASDADKHAYEQGMAQISSLPQQPGFEGNDPSVLIDRAQAEQQIRQKLPQKQWVKRPPSTAEQMQSSVTPIKGEDGGVVGYAHPKDVAFTPLRQSGHSSSAEPISLPQGLVEGGDGMLYQESADGSGPPAPTGMRKVDYEFAVRSTQNNGVRYFKNAKGEFVADPASVERMKENFKLAQDRIESIPNYSAGSGWAGPIPNYRAGEDSQPQPYQPYGRYPGFSPDPTESEATADVSSEDSDQQSYSDQQNSGKDPTMWDGLYHKWDRRQRQWVPDKDRNDLANKQRQEQARTERETNAMDRKAQDAEDAFVNKYSTDATRNLQDQIRLKYKTLDEAKADPNISEYLNKPYEWTNKIRETGRAIWKKEHPDRQQSSSQQPAPQNAAPQVGEVRRGYQYTGGDPASPSSWKKVQ